MNGLMLVGQHLLSLGASLGAGSIITNAIKFTTPDNVSKIGKVGIAIGGVFMSCMIGDKVGDFAYDKLDKLRKGELFKIGKEPEEESETEGEA